MSTGPVTDSYCSYIAISQYFFDARGVEMVPTYGEISGKYFVGGLTVGPN